MHFLTYLPKKKSFHKHAQIKVSGSMKILKNKKGIVSVI